VPIYRLFGVFAAASAIACSGPETASDAGPPPCTIGFLGDPKSAPVIELVTLDESYISTPLQDGGTVSLMFPPQGGRVIFAGVRATHVDACAVRLAGALRDLQTKQVRIDTRTVNLEPTGDGWGRSIDSDISTFANIAVCPNQWADTDVFGIEYELIVSVTDRAQRKATQTVRVVPLCTEPEHAEECLCICKGGYVLGENCAASTDGGMP
jgi:hypothetical protein